MYSYAPPPNIAEQKQDDQLEHIHSTYVRIRDVALKTCLRRWMIGKRGERGSGISVLWHDIMMMMMLINYTLLYLEFFEFLRQSLIFIIKCFRTIVFIVIVIFTTFLPSSCLLEGIEYFSYLFIYFTWVFDHVSLLTRTHICIYIYIYIYTQHQRIFLPIL